MYESELNLEGRVRAVLRELTSGRLSETDAALALRGEVVAGFFRGREAEKKRSGQRRSFGH